MACGAAVGIMVTMMVFQRAEVKVSGYLQHLAFSMLLPNFTFIM